MLPFKALLVEGTSGVGKSTLIDALIRRHVGSSKPKKIRSLVHLAQSHTYGPLAVREGHGLTREENRQHLERIVGLLEWLHASVQEHTKPWCFVLIDAMPLTYCVRPGVAQWGDIEPFDRTLAALGCKLLFLRVAPETIWERGIKARANEQFIQEYAKKFGRNNEEIHRYFVEEQETLAGLFARSVMPKMLLENDAGGDHVLEQAFQFWTGDRDADVTAGAVKSR